MKKLTGTETRQSFIDFFVEHNHTFVPSASLVPGGDSTLLFTNAGMVQFKDVFLGTDRRPYTRAVDSQKCMRVAGKHNDLDDVGRDDYHHTFFEMLGNWSFGDYYKKEAIAWAWQLLTDVWELPKDKIYITCFKDEKDTIPTDDEAAEIWRLQPGIHSSHILFFGRKENFWEMAETGPCGPCSEIHIDRGEEFDNLAGKPHRCGVNGECQRYLELWNNVFIQYNRISPDSLEPLPATHVDTGMGFERIVAVLQGVDSNYKIDLFSGLLDTVRQLAGDTIDEMYANFTPYRVIADHARAAAFLIADGVVPGNVGRNYVSRMIIRRAARFGSKIGLNEPFLARAAEAVIIAYKGFYPELEKHRESILDHITREEVRFARTIVSGTAQLMEQLEAAKKSKSIKLDGRKAFDLYSTYGLPFEIARDIARERGQDIEESGFSIAMDEHRLASGSGKAMGKLDGRDAEFYNTVKEELLSTGKINHDAVLYDPYDPEIKTGRVLALVADGHRVLEAEAGEKVEILLPQTGFYIESGGQVSDTGVIRSAQRLTNGDPEWEIEIEDVRKPAPGVIIHVGEVIYGHPREGDEFEAIIDRSRRQDIMRNHTATHLLHAALEKVLGKTARQAGSLVAPDHLRFDFTYPQAMTNEQIEQVERLVNDAIYSEMEVTPEEKNREEAINAGATALFGEKYGERVRTISIQSQDDIDEPGKHSYELCGGTHIKNTSEIGMFLILSEGSAAAGIRRIEAVTGRQAYDLVVKRFTTIKNITDLLRISDDEVFNKVGSLQEDVNILKKQLNKQIAELAFIQFNEQLDSVRIINGIHMLHSNIPGLDHDTLAKLADKFRDRFPERSICAIVSPSVNDIDLVVAVTKDIITRGIKAGDLAGLLSRSLGGGGGGAPHLAFGGGKDISRLNDAFVEFENWIKQKTV